MKKVPSTEVKKRSRELTAIFESFTPYQGLEGRIERIWITEIATDGIHLVSCPSHSILFLRVKELASLSYQKHNLILKTGWTYQRIHPSTCGCSGQYAGRLSKCEDNVGGKVVGFRRANRRANSSERKHVWRAPRWGAVSLFWLSWRFVFEGRRSLPMCRQPSL